MKNNDRRFILTDTVFNNFKPASFFKISYKKISLNWKNGLPLLKSNLYELSQLFATKFNHQPNSITQLFE